MSHHAPPAPPTSETPEPARTPKRRGRRALIAAVTLVAFLGVYALSLFGFYLLAKSSGPLPAVDHDPADETVVSVRLDKLDTVANRLTVKVLVIPQKSLYNK
jgi:Domain of unknown function (DUF4436)